ELIDDGKPVLRYRAGAMHDQMRIGNAAMNLLDPVDGQNVTGRWPRELVGSMARTHRDRQCINVSFLHETRGLVRVGKQLTVVQYACSPDAILLASGARLQRAKASQLAFHRNAAGMSHVYHGTGHAD